MTADIGCARPRGLLLHLIDLLPVWASILGRRFCRLRFCQPCHWGNAFCIVAALHSRSLAFRTVMHVVVHSDCPVDVGWQLRRTLSPISIFPTLFNGEPIVSYAGRLLT